jgi:hypothetical protein
MEVVFYWACGRQEKNKVLVGKPREKILRQRREDNIKMHLKYIEWKAVDWLYLIQGTN